LELLPPVLTGDEPLLIAAEPPQPAANIELISRIDKQTKRTESSCS
jgi:hypothetical protein